MRGLARSGGDLGREGQVLGFHGARVSQSRWPVRWRQVLVGCGGAAEGIAGTGLAETRSTRGERSGLVRYVRENEAVEPPRRVLTSPAS